MPYELTDGFIVPAPIDEVWSFFSDAGNLARITPPWLGFEMGADTRVPMGQGTVLHHTVRWMRLPVRWRSLIVEWTPGRSFADLQISGPYKLWLHRHEFEPLNGGGVRCTDHVVYELPAGPFGRLAHAMLVRKQLLEIFVYRRQRIAELLGRSEASQERPLLRRL